MPVLIQHEDGVNKTDAADGKIREPRLSSWPAWPPRSSPAARGSGGRFRRFAAALFAFTAMGSALPAAAQIANTLISNTSQTTSTVSSTLQSQPFTTGDDATGYRLTSVEIRIGNLMNRDTSVRVVPNASGGEPDLSDPTQFIVLTAPTLAANTLNTFTAPSNTTLDANTTYHAYVSAADNGMPDPLQRTTSSAEDSGGASGWSIGNTRYWRSSSSDAWRTSTSLLLRIKINGSAIGNAPTVANEIPDQHGGAGTAFTYAFPSDTFNDVDGDALTYTATKSDGIMLPMWLGFTASTRRFSGTPGAADVGTLAVKVTASDGISSVSDEFNIVVRAAGLAHCTSNPLELWCTSLTVGTGIFRDGSRYYGSLHITTFGNFGSYGPTSRVFSYRRAEIIVDLLAHNSNSLAFVVRIRAGPIPPGGLFGTRSHTLELGTDSTKRSFSIVNPGFETIFNFANPGLSWSVDDVIPVKLVRSNAAPVVATAIPNQTAPAGRAFRYAFPSGTFSDADSDALTYTATKPDDTALPTWLSFAATTRTFSGTPGAADVGTVAVKVTASDGEASSSDEFNIVVSAAGLAHCIPLDPLDLWCASLTVGDLGGDPIGYDSILMSGSLSPNQFTYEGTPYTVTALTVLNGILNLRLQPSGERAFGTNPRFALRSGTTNFSFADTTIFAGGNGDLLRFGQTPPTWAVNDVVPIKLSRVLPTAANKTVKAGADADYPFTAADFNLLDTGYGLKVVTLPRRGTLALDGVPVSVGDSVSQARVDAGDLTYTPPQDEIGKGISHFTFRVNDGELESARSAKITIDVDNKLAGNLDETAHGTALSLPDTDINPNINAYAQGFRTGSAAQELAEVKLAITVPSGTTPKVSIWSGDEKPEHEAEGLTLTNPSNIHTASAVMKTFKATGRYSLATDSDKYWIVIERASGSGTISLKRSSTAIQEATAQGWGLLNRWKRSGSASWSGAGSLPLMAELRTVPERRYAIRILNMELSGPGPDELYTHGENLDIAVTFSEAVNIPKARITAPLVCGGDASHESGNGTNRVVFRCEIKGGPHTRVEVRATTLRIRPLPAGDTRDPLPDVDEDGTPVSNAHPAVERMTAAHGVAGPGITDVEVSSPGPDGVWTPGERVELRYTFDEPMTVTTGSGMPVAWIQRVYESGKVYGEAVPFNRIDTNDASTLVFTKTLSGNERATALKIPADSVYPKHGVIADTDTKAIAVFTHREYHIEPGPSCGALADEIWCAEMKVGTKDEVTGFGAGEYGSLSPRKFNYGGVEYTVNTLTHHSSSRFLYLALTPNTGHSIINKAGFRLHLGTRSHSFPGDVSNSAFIRWTNVDSFWTPGDRVFVRLTGPPASNNQVEVVAPTVEGTPSLSPAGPDSLWAEGETVEVTIAFSEAVEVNTTGGTPSVGIGLGGPVAKRSADYLRGSGTLELVFAYTLIEGDGGHAAMAVTPDSLALNGGAIQSVATSVDAALAHNGTIVQGVSGRSSVRDVSGRSVQGPTARFGGVPARHDGTSAFTVELHFSAEPDGLSYRIVQDGLLEATGGTVTRARRLTKGSNLGWEVTVEPDGAGDIALLLPARSCEQPNAVCVGGRALARAAEATVPGVPFTASFSNVPSEDDGTSPFELEFRLSTEPAGLSYRTVQNGLFDVSGGTIGRAWRLQKGNNAGWGLRIEASGFGDVTLTLRATTDCAGTPGVCTSDGRMLAGGLQATIAGPPTLAVADAEVDENSGATLDFAVTLSRVLTDPVTVGYSTADDTASAGADYTNTTGTLTFAAGETLKTVSVPVLDDEHDEGSETMTLTISNPSPARVKLADAEATGVINNTDAMPRAWLARFGRAASDHAVEAISNRWQGEARSDNHLTIGGRPAGDMLSWPGLGGRGDRDEGDDGLDDGSDGDAPVRSDPFSMQMARGSGFDRASAGAGRMGGAMDGPGMRSGAAGMDMNGNMDTGMGTGEGDATGEPMPGGPDGAVPETGTTLGGRDARDAAIGAVLRSLGLPEPGAVGDLRQALMGSSFFYSPRSLDGDGESPAGAGWMGRWSAWGETASTRFRGADGPLTLDGEVSTATLGLDSRWGRWHAGMAMAYSMGDGLYTHPRVAGGEVSSTLASLHPFARFEINERASVWGVLGYGRGELSLTPEGGEEAIETDLATTMAAFGGRGIFAVRLNRLGEFQFALASDARMTNTTSEAVRNLVDAGGATSRVRLMLEGSGSMPLAGGGMLRPSLEAGLRYDDGDAETGAGLEVGGGLAYAAGRLAVQVKARMLVAHEDAAYEEWGFSSSIMYQPGQDGRGLSMNLGSSWGATQSGVRELWSRRDVRGLAPGAARPAGQAFQAEFGYGLGGRGNTDRLWYPYIGAQAAEGSGEMFTLGLKLSAGPELSAALEIGRRDNGQESPEHALQLQGSYRW